MGRGSGARLCTGSAGSNCRGDEAAEEVPYTGVIRSLRPHRRQRWSSSAFDAWQYRHSMSYPSFLPPRTSFPALAAVFDPCYGFRLGPTPLPRCQALLLQLSFILRNIFGWKCHELYFMRYYRLYLITALLATFALS